MSCYVLDPTTQTNTSTPCNDVTGSINLFTGQLEFDDYGYFLTKWASYLFLVLYAGGFLAHVLLAIFWKTWWTLPTFAAGALVETIGWAGRVWSIQSWAWDPNNGGSWTDSHSAFIMQICCLVIGPTFFSAGNYILLGRLIRATNPTFSSLHPRSLGILFIFADFVCLVVQGVGGGIAGSADTQSGADTGAYIMTAGVVLQLVITVFFLAVFAEWYYRRHRSVPARRQFAPLAAKASRQDREDRGRLLGTGAAANNTNGMDMTPLGSVANGKEGSQAYVEHGRVDYGGHVGVVPSKKRVEVMAGMIVFTSLLIVLRSLYRSVELTDGWSGPIATNQPLFLGMDALLMAILVWAYVFVHPGLAFGRRIGK